MKDRTLLGLVAMTAGALGAVPVGLALGGAALLALFAPVDVPVAEPLIALVAPEPPALAAPLTPEKVPLSVPSTSEPGSFRGSPTSPERRAPPPPPPLPSAPRAISQTGSSTWAIDADLVDRYAADPAALASLGYVAKQQDGFQLHGIQPGTPLHALGLRSGDLLSSVNGYPVQTQVQVLTALAMLQGKSRFDLAFVRNGQLRTHTYRLE